MDVKEIVKNKQGTLIDVRNQFELAEGAIPGAINIPVSEIPYHIDEIKKMNGPLVLFCRSGNRSSMALMILQSAGIKTEMHNGGCYYDMLDYLN